MTAQDEIQKTTETRVVEGIRLSFEKLTYHIGVPYDTGTETLEVFIEASTLVALCEQGEWDSQLGGALLLDYHEGMALEQAGLAEQETRGGFHGTDEVRALCRRLGWY